MADDFVVNILNELSLNESVIQVFKDEEIDRAAFVCLTENMLVNLVPKIGQRAKVLNKINELKKIEENNDNQSLVDSGSSKYNIFENGNLREILLLEDNTVFTNNSAHNLLYDKNNTNLFDVNPNSNLNEDTPSTINYDNTNTNLTSLNNEIVSEPVCVESYKKKNSVKEILLNHSEGNIILNFYEVHQSLNSVMRNKMTHIIITSMLQQNENQTLQTNCFKTLSLEIIKLFPTETSQTYFIPYQREGNKKTPNRGKLWDKYCNLRKIIREISNKSKSSEIISDDSSSIRSINYEGIEDDILWLKNNVAPWETLLEKWDKTFQLRYNNCVKITEEKNMYFKDYPGLKTSTAFILIENDFNKLYPEKELTLFIKFELFKKQLVMYVEKCTPKFIEKCSVLINELKTPSSPGCDDIAAIKLLMELFSPVNIKRKIGINSKTQWRPSKIEMKQAFIYFTNNFTQLKEIDIEKKEKALRKGLSIQPYMIFVNDGNNDLEVSSYYVLINSNYIKLESCLKAIDVCFKCFFAFHLNFPIECEVLWIFIQKYFYDITTKFDNNFQQVNSIMHDLNICK